MSAMADLDIVLTEHKLSDAQKNAVVELFSGGATVAKAVTFKALERKGLVTKVDDFWQLTQEFRASLNVAAPITLEPSPWELGPEKFDKDWAMWERELCGFEATIPWKNTDVWHGLTAQEIREDMDTAVPVGRKARRESARIMRRALAAV